MKPHERKYYKAVVEFKQMFEFVVVAKDIESAKEKAKDNWNAEDPIFSEIEIYDITRLGETND